jgi:hypothetical protein
VGHFQGQRTFADAADAVNDNQVMAGKRIRSQQFKDLGQLLFPAHKLAVIGLG